MTRATTPSLPGRGLGRGLGCALGCALALALVGCASAEDAFTAGRIENLCVQAVPACGRPARCELTGDQFLRSRFPGGERLLVRTYEDVSRVRVRMLLLDRRYPGTELLVRGFDTGCRDYDEVLYRDLDLFALAGDDGVLEVEVEVRGRGDHPLEVFGDLASEYLLAVEVVEP
jgi:hypothetical protein